MQHGDNARPEAQPGLEHRQADQSHRAQSQAVAADSSDRADLWRLAQTCREKGDLEAATSIYQRLATSDPKSQVAGYLAAMLSQQPLPIASPVVRPWPAPFVRIKQFLPQSLHDHVLAFACEHQDQFRPAHSSGQYRPSVRKARVLYWRDLDAVRSEFLARLEALLPDVFPRLQLAPFRPHEIEMQLTASLDGDFFALHQDNAVQRARRMTYVYYFQRTPKCFSGGNLLLYDTDLPAASPSIAYTRIGPIDNSLILFHSDYLHEVTPVTCASCRFIDGRFTLNGWMRTAPGTATRRASVFRG